MIEILFVLTLLALNTGSYITVITTRGMGEARVGTFFDNHPVRLAFSFIGSPIGVYSLIPMAFLLFSWYLAPIYIGLGFLHGFLCYPFIGTAQTSNPFEIKLIFDLLGNIGLVIILIYLLQIYEFI